MNSPYELIKNKLLPYQADWVIAKHRLKIGLWARQTGKDYSATAEAVVDSITRPGTLWLILAAGERQALESLAKAKDWARQMRLPIHEYDERRPTPDARPQPSQEKNIIPLTPPGQTSGVAQASCLPVPGLPASSPSGSTPYSPCSFWFMFNGTPWTVWKASE